MLNISVKNQKAVETGVGFGTALAICISWSLNHSVIWAIIHGILTWFYVLYYIFFLR